jgi:hypothetical protein
MDTMQKVATAKRLIEAILKEFDLKITVDEDDGDPVLHDKDTWYEVPLS